mmetsp:Transcript_23210/g.58060  ORF Transcript_23210/g.58060 Transcript_23210/m.58060 type:complete len:620 (-) Transcript_23210:343-2202(-)
MASLSVPVLTLFLCILFSGSSAKSYQKGEDIPTHFDSLLSNRTQIPFYFEDRLPFFNVSRCDDQPGLGERIIGRSCTRTPLKFRVLVESHCSVFGSGSVSREDVSKLNFLIDNNYAVQLYVDDFLVGVAHDDNIDPGFQLGTATAGLENQPVEYILYNHWDFKFLYRTHANETSGEWHEIVGVVVEPVSRSYLAHADQADLCLRFGSTGHFSLGEGENTTSTRHMYPITYSVSWELTNRTAHELFESYYESEPAVKFLLLNNLLLTALVTTCFVIILIRTLHINVSTLCCGRVQQNDINEIVEYVSWKLLHGDVFRPPENRLAFAVCIGSGVQLLLAAVVTVILGAVGFFTPANHGAHVTVLLTTYVLMSAIGGFVSTRIYADLDGQNWKRVTALTVLVFPLFFLLLFLIVQIILNSNGSSAALHSDIFFIFAVWLFLLAPMTFLGGFAASRKSPYNPPILPNPIPRDIPKKEWYKSTWFVIVVLSLIPSVTILFASHTLLEAIWSHEYFYYYGYLLAEVFLTMVVTAEICIMGSFALLCMEDFRWWWPSFLIGSFSGVWVFLYCLYYGSAWTNPSTTGASVLYLLVCVLLCTAYALMSGAIGFYGTYSFVKAIYNEKN